MKKTKKILALLVAVAVTLAMMPAMVSADTGTVDVCIANTTYDSGPWKGKLAEIKVPVSGKETVTAVTKKAAAQANIALEWKDSFSGEYLNGVKGLTAGVSGYSGWTYSINDWFGSGGMNVDTVEAGDELNIVYTVTWSDLGASYGNHDKSIKTLASDKGTVSPAFSGKTKDYTLTVPAGTNEVKITPTAVNKNFMVKTSVGTKEYKRGSMIPVSEGTEITVKCGDPSWPTMESAASVPAEVYSITVNVSLAAPKIKAGSVSYNTNKISWKKVDGAAGYKVYRSTKKTSGFKRVKTTKATSWKNTKLKTGKTYYYKVRAYKERNGKQVYSKHSNVAKAKPVPAAPMLKLTAGSNSIKATWSKVKGSNGYKLYRATSKAGKYKAIRNAKGSWNRDYTSVNKKSGKKYYFKVRAYKTVNGKNVYGKMSAVKVMAAK
ncbi:MAG: hypothetical protein VB031_03880 [Eubacteriaceae bacterium]|nr:hypothetical protein [Eubacteriaceae bacterium]